MSVNLGYIPNTAVTRLVDAPPPPPKPEPPRRWRGLGDALHAVLRAVGVVKFVEARTKATGKPCGCAARREALNKAVPFSSDSPKGG